MNIVFIWIHDFYTIKNQGFNFGSNHTYNHKYDNNTLEISRVKNGKYVKNLFKHDKKGFSNITAIVGENGAGKTNLLKCLCEILNNNPQNEIVVLLEEEDKIYLKRTSFKVGKIGSYLGHKRERDDIKVITEGFSVTELAKIEFSKLIYYSPIYDFDDYFLRNDNLLNISSNYLINQDLENDALDIIEFPKGNLEFHRFSEVKRQIQFVSSVSSAELIKNLNLPSNISILFKDFPVPDIEEEGSIYLRDLHISKKLLELRKEIWIDESNKIHGLITKNYTDKLHDNDNLNKWELFHYFLKSSFGCLIYNVNRSGEFYWRNRFDTAEKKLIQADFSIDLDYSKMGVSDSSHFEIFFEIFLQNQETFNGEIISDFIKKVKKYIFSNSVENVFDSRKLILSLEDGLIFLEDYRIFMLESVFYKQNEKRLPFTLKTGFIEFDWRDMSSGEKAFLNLFSRINFAHNILKNSSEGYPESIFLLIDEGELGFHLQWQKEYILKLIENVPLILNDADNIQLIFSTHSPVVLSDIPRENLILFKKKSGITEVETSNQLNTFGANIHDILRSDFFMRNGLIGDFAKELINDTIEKLNNLDYLDDRIKARQIIELIDEPILRFKLEEMYAKKYGGEDEMKNSLKAKIDYLQKRLAKLEEDDNNKE